MKKYQVLKWIVFSLAVAINLFIIINAFINGEVSAKESNTVAQSAAEVINTVKPDTITPQNYDRFAFDIRKAFGHFGLFGLSGVFSSWSLYLFLKDTRLGYFVWQILLSLSIGFVLAIVSEFIQIFIDGRTGAWVDVGIDFSGFFLGIFMVFLILLIRKSKIFWMENYIKNQVD